METKKLKRAIESDACYYFDPAKLAAAKAAAASDDVDLYPNPDLAVEVDVSPPKIDRPGMYVSLQVPEFWRVAAAGKCPSSADRPRPIGRGMEWSNVPVPWEATSKAS